VTPDRAHRNEPHYSGNVYDVDDPRAEFGYSSDPLEAFITGRVVYSTWTTEEPIHEIGLNVFAISGSLGIPGSALELIQELIAAPILILPRPYLAFLDIYGAFQGLRFTNPIQAIKELILAVQQIRGGLYQLINSLVGVAIDLYAIIVNDSLEPELSLRDPGKQEKNSYQCEFLHDLLLIHAAVFASGHRTVLAESPQ
jgi:hypothetical protein